MSITIENLLKSSLMDSSTGELLIDNSAFLTGVTEPLVLLQKVKIHYSVEMSVNICTLGHVDNGKTTTTAALAGSSVKNIDRSTEEQERGITINTTVVQYKRAFIYKRSELPENVLARIQKINPALELLCANSIAYLNEAAVFNAVPVSSDVLDLGEDYVLVHATFVQADAPGHRDFLKNAIKGMASADVILLIVGSHYESLSEQRQTLEHLYLLRKFGIAVAVFFNQIDTYFQDDVKKAVGLVGEGSKEAIEPVISSADEMATLNLSGLFGEITKSLGEVVGPLERLPHETSKLIGVIGVSALLASKFDLSRPLAARQCTAQMQHSLNELLKAILTYSSHSVIRKTTKPFCLNIEGAPKVGRGIVYTGTVMCGSIKVGDEITVYTKKDRVDATIISMQQFHKDQQQSFAGDNIAMLLRATADTAKYMDQVGPHCVITAKNAPYIPVKKIVCKMYFYGTDLGGRAKDNIIKAGYSGTIFIKSGNYNYAVCVKEAYPMYEINSKYSSQKTLLDPANSAAGVEKKGGMTVMVPGDRVGYMVVLESLSQDMVLPITTDAILFNENDLGLVYKDNESITNAKKAAAQAAGAKNGHPAFVQKLHDKYNTIFNDQDTIKDALSFVFMESDLSVGSGYIVSIIKP